MRVAVTGASGLVGTALTEHLIGAGHHVRTLVRRAPSRASEVRWDPATGEIDRDSLTDIEAIVHLAGAGIGDRRWTPEYKRLIRASRVAGTRLIASTAATLPSRPAVLSSSAVGYYGDTGDRAVDETAPSGEGFLASVCREWEEATEPAERADLRVVHLRSGVVLSTKGGPLARQLPVFRLGLGGRNGPGTQYISWVAIDDTVRAVDHLLRSELRGPVNLTSPGAVTNAEYAKALGRALHRPTTVTPMLGPRLLFGRELADTLLLIGQRVVPSALSGDGFRFSFTRLDEALDHLLA